MHAHFQDIDVAELRRFGKLRLPTDFSRFLLLLLTVSSGVLLLGLLSNAETWSWVSLWTITVFFIGVGFAGPAISAILLIVKARWSSIGVRIFESLVIVGWLGYFFFWVCYFGKETLFPWADGSGLPGKEAYMQPGFTYIRHGALLLVYLLYSSWFVWRGIRQDLQFITGSPGYHADYADWEYISENRANFDDENVKAHRTLGFHAPILVILYGIVMSLFAFEFIMGMDPIWYSNLFGGHYFVTSMYTAWGFGIVLSVIVKSFGKHISKLFDTQFFWDIGKLFFGFSMLWAYFSFSQFLVQWYGNLPEETAWIALRMREYPWKTVTWLVFLMCFVFPFLTLLSRDVKKNHQLLMVPVTVALIGMYIERSLIIAPAVVSKELPADLWHLTVFSSGLIFSVSSILYFSLKLLAHYPHFAFGRHIFIEDVRAGRVKIVEPS